MPLDEELIHRHDDARQRALQLRRHL